MKRYTLSVRLPFFALTLALVGMGIFAKRGWLDWRRMVRNNDAMSQQILVASNQRNELEKQIRALETSSFAQEQAVRQHLGYVRKNEIVVEHP